MRNEVSIFIFIIGVAAFNWPLLKIFDFSLTAYLFALWFLFITIVLIYSLKEKNSREDN